MERQVRLWMNREQSAPVSARASVHLQPGAYGPLHWGTGDTTFDHSSKLGVY